MILGCRCVRTRPWNPKKPKECPEALRLWSIVVMNEDSPTPCGQEIEVDLLEHSDIAICGSDTLSLEVYSYDLDAFDEAPSIDANGILTIKTGDIKYNKRNFYKVVIKGTCGQFGDYMTVYVSFTDPCDCAPGETCVDNCGTCE